MSSHTEPAAGAGGARARRAALWSRIAPYFSWLAAGLGLALLAIFALQAGLFALLMPAAPLQPPVIESPTDVTSYESKFTGFDKDNQPYWVTAEHGSQDNDNSNILHLRKITAQFSNKAGEVYDVTAAMGDYDKKENSMAMTGGVVIRQGQRFTARMDEADALIGRKELSSEVDVAVDFADATIAAKGLQITDDGNIILFFNGVHARFGIKAGKGEKTQ